MSKKSQTDRGKFNAMTDEDIDTSDVPELTETFFANATLNLPRQSAVDIIVRVDQEILKWCQAQGSDNAQVTAAAPRIYADAHRCVRTGRPA